jgi:hypothetical protein
MLGSIGWIELLKSCSDEDRRTIVKMINKKHLVGRHRQDCNYEEEGNI